MSNTKPNFFIVGGPKCGTTAMVSYLRTHPSVFISEPKEPNFLADDMPKIKFVDNLKDYLRLFNKATENKVIGDASIFYMFSQVAIKNIFKLNPKAKLLVMIRNPIEMVPSFHLQILYTMEEDEKDFNRVLELEKYRKLGKNLPRYNKTSKLLNYSEIAKYGEQLENIYKYFPKNQVKVILFDDFKKSNRNAYVEVLDFLEVEDDGKTEFPRVNDAKKAKNKLINRIVNRPPKFAKAIAKMARKVLNKPRLGILSTIDHLNRGKLEKKQLTVQEKKQLVDIYKDDIKKTEKILAQDLSSWLA